MKHYKTGFSFETAHSSGLIDMGLERVGEVKNA